mgnify:CR=1 FL=1|tara:strand:+ start:1905 stop:2612 length:708 start_codon:yes stop_codon:yes gene_type:complete
MIENTPCPWLTEGPVDYELRNYKMLAEIAKLRKRLSLFEVWPVIQSVENQLEHLYKMKYDVETLVESRKIAKDIDFFNFEIIYEEIKDDKSKEYDTFDLLIEDAILEFGDIYADAREIWREVEKDIRITWVPKKPNKLNLGYVFIPYQDETTLVYLFEKPTKMINGWRRMKLELVDKFETSNNNLVEFCDKSQDEAGSIMFCRADLRSNMIPLKDALIPVLQSMLFTELTKNFTS